MTSNCFRILAVDDDKAILNLYSEILCATQEKHQSSPSAGNPVEGGILASNEQPVIPRPAGSPLRSDTQPVFEPTLCEQAEEAVEAVRTAAEEGRPFAVVFMDIRLPPGPDGVWAAEQIRNLDPNIGIVLVTGYFDTDLGEVERRVPSSDKLHYLQKPFYNKEIWQVALSLSSKWQVENELRTVHCELETKVEERTLALKETNTMLEKEIKKRVKAVESSLASESNFRNMIEGNADGIIIFDENETVLFVNPSAERLFSRDAEDLIGETLGYPLVAGETTELDIVRGTGSPLVAEMRVTETKWQGEKAFLASLRDITDHSQTKEALRKAFDDLKNTMSGTIRAMAAMAERKDPYTSGHQQRVAGLSRAIAMEMGLLPSEIEGLYLASLIHDIGKISIPSQILVKPTPLTDLEFRMIRIHSKEGYDMLEDVQFAWPIARIVLQHHERMDGSGYPQGLPGEDILKEARILAVADVVEAMASHRPYRPALGIEKALDEISKGRGLIYDADVVDACLKVLSGKDFRWD